MCAEALEPRRVLAAASLDVPTGLEHAVEWNGSFYFANNPTSGGPATLIGTDGTRAGTAVRFTNTYAGSGLGRMYGLTEWNGSLYFLGEVAAQNRFALFKWSTGQPAPLPLTGTTSGQAMSRAQALTYRSQSKWFVASGSFLYFCASPIGSNDPTLLRTDGTASGTIRLSTSTNAAIAYPSYAIDFKGRLLFYGITPSAGFEPMISDGTNAGTTVVADVAPGASGSLTYPPQSSSLQASFTRLGDWAYFTALNSTNFPFFGLLRTDGTAAGTSVVPTPQPQLIPLSFGQSVAFKNRLYFAAKPGGSGELSVYSIGHGNADLRRESGAFGSIGTFFVSNDWLFFTATPTTQFNNSDLFRLSSAANSVELVHDLIPGVVDDVGLGTFPRLSELNGSLYFTASSPGPDNGRDLWRSVIDTRQAQSVAVAIPPDDTDPRSYYLHAAIGQIFFEVDGPNFGLAAWRYVPGVGLIDRRFELTPAGPRVVFEFDTPVNPASVTVADLSTLNLTTNSPGSAATSVSVSPDGLTATFTLPKSLADGRYRFTIGTGKLSAATGTDTNESDFVHTGGDAFMLGGDANRDGLVNFDDLLLLAANYNQNGKAWPQGDFTYDDTVNFDDLLILAARYNQSLSATSGPAALRAEPPPPLAVPSPDAPEDGDADSAGVLA